MKFNKPKIAIWNAKEQTANLIEVTAPQNYNVVSAIDNKMTKYKDLQIEIKKTGTWKYLLSCRLQLVNSGLHVTSL